MSWIWWIAGALLALLAVFALVLFLIAPGRRRDYSAFSGRLYAHRGLHGNGIPENSLAAFRAAAEKGYGAELDVQFTADRKIVVMHNRDLKAACGDESEILGLTYEQLSAYRLYGTDEKIPLFSEALEALNGAPLICEIKNYSGNRCPELCAGTYELLKDYRGPWCVESFSPYIVGWFRRNHPEVIRGQLSSSFDGDSSMGAFNRFMLRNLLVNKIGRPDFIAYQFGRGAWGYRLCRAVFRPFTVLWTPRGENEIREAKKISDTVIFEK